jgi:hypothetical protein
MMRIKLGHPSVFDTHFLAEQGVVLVRLIQFSFQSDAGIDTIRGPTAGIGHGELGEGDYVEDPGLYGSGPAFGQGNLGARFRHGSFRERQGWNCRLPSKIISR